MTLSYSTLTIFQSIAYFIATFRWSLLLQSAAIFVKRYFSAMIRLVIYLCIGREVKKRVQTGWNGWRRMSGVICDRRVPARVKVKVYNVAMSSAMLYRLETVALTKRQEAEMEVAEMNTVISLLTIFVRSDTNGQNQECV